MKRSGWYLVAGILLSLLLFIGGVMAMNTGKVLDKPVLSKTEAKHWQMLHLSFIEHRNRSLVIEPWYGGKVEVLVSQKTFKSINRGEWYYGEW